MQLKFNKFLLLFILLSSISKSIYAQNVTVNSTGGTATASYSTLGNAFAAINAGTHTTVITISITANTSEAAGGAVLNASGSGSASYSSIVITPSGARTVSAAVTAGSPLIDLNGADNVKINGLNTGGNSLTISNTTASGTSGTSTIRFIGGATSNKITNCTILGSFSAAVGTNGGNIFFTTDAVTANGNDNDTISNCDIGPAGSNLSTKGVYMNGSTTTTAINNSGNLITNNNIFDYFGAAVSSAGVYIGGGNTNNNVTNNKFYQTASRTQTTGAQHSGIWITNTTGNNFLVSGNTIGFAASNGTGTYTFVGVSSTSVLIPIFLNVGTTTSTSVQGNTIAGIAISGACSGQSNSAPFRGVYVSSGLTNIGDVTGNTIGSQSATGSITYTSSATSASDVIGMYNYGSSNWTVNNNKIGGITAANSSTGASNIYGLRCYTSTTTTTSLLNNTIGGTISNSIQSTTTAAGSIVAGIFITTSYATVTGDTIRNLTAAGGTGTTTAASVNGICFVGSTVNNTCSQNIIHSLSNTNSSAATTITGIQYTSSTGTNLISRNFIHSLNSASTSGILNGIQVSGGTATYQNNMIRLGIDASGSSITTACTINGVNELSGINNFYFNSIYIGGTGVGTTASNSFAFGSAVTTSTRIYRNNLFQNSRSNSTTGGKHYAVKVGGTAANPNGLSVNNNLYYANGTGGVFGFFNSADVTSLTAWQTAVGQDGSSGYYDASFIAATGTASTVDLHLSSTNPAEGAGVSISGITDDYDGQTRSGLSPTDLGADAGNFTAIDIFSPVISYTTLGNGFVVSTRTTSNFATITDGSSGVDTASGTRPRIYYKKSTDNNAFVGNTSSNNGWKNVKANNTSSPFDFTIDYAIINGGSVAVNDVIQYFVVAQDKAGTPNVSSNPSAGFSGSLVSSISAAPTTPNSYIIVTALSTSLNVGTGQTYTSLTGTGGLFEAINNAALSGNTTVSITSDLSEDGTNALNNVGLAGYTLNIIPSTASTRTISNSTTLSQAMIRLNGAIGVTFDGRSGGSGQYLRIVNTHTTPASGMPAIQVLGGATSNTIRNCIVETNTSSTTQATILMGTGTNSLTLKANDIRDAQGTPGTAGIPYAGVYSNTSTNTITVGGSAATDGNSIYNFTNFGLNLASIADAGLVQYNSFFQSSARSTVLINVNIASGSTHTVSNNNIYQTSGTNTAAYTGINIIGGGSGHTVNSNSIGGSNASRSGSALTINAATNVNGILLTVGTTTATNVQGNYFSNFGNITTSTTGSVFAINASAGNINIGTSAGNIIGGGAAAYDTVLNAYDNGMINYSGTGNVDIENNTIGNTAYYRNAGDRNAGISITGSCQAIIKNNNINNIKGNATGTFPTSYSPMGIFISGAITSGSNIEGNTISNIYNTSTGTAAYQSSGLYISGAAVSGTTVKSNKIYNIKADGTGAGTLSPQVTGIYLASSSSIVFSNNQISVGTGTGSEARVFGIYDGSTGTNKYYYNSIYVNGSISAGSNNSFCHYRSSTSITTLRNNLLYNERAGGAGANYPIATVNSGNFVSDYNLFVSRDIANVGNYVSTNYNFASWKSNSGGDASSWSALYSLVNSDSLFTDKTNGDLSIKTNQTQGWYANGKGIAGASSGSIATDFSGGARSTTYGFGTDIGANEFVPISKPALATQTGTIANNDSTTYTFAGRVIASIKWRNAIGTTTTFPSAMSVYYYSGTTPPDPTNAGAYSTSKYMNGFWQISPTGGVHFLYDITLLYDEATLGTIPSESSIKLGKKPALTGTGDWKVHYGSAVNTTLNTASFNSLNEFSVFTLSDNAKPLPIKLVSFNAAVSNENALLTWQSSNEINGSHYNILRSFDGTNFDQIGAEKSTGSKLVLTNYSFVDANAAKLYNGKHIYYRLEMVDMDGTAEFSETRHLYLKDGLQANSITPLFIDNNLNIKLNLSDDSKLTISLLDLNGKLLLSSTNQYAKGISISSINTTEIATGLYLVKVENAGEVMITKVFKN